MLNTLKSWAKRYSDTEAAVHDATSTDPWGPSGTEMYKIAMLTYSYKDFVEIREMLGKRLNDEGKNWRQVYKSLVLIDYILHHGSEDVITYFKYNLYVIRALEKFHYIDDIGEDHGQKVRAKARNIISLVLDEGRLHTERRTWASMHSRILMGGIEKQIEKSKRKSKRQEISHFDLILDSGLTLPSPPSYIRYGGDGTRPLPTTATMPDSTENPALLIDVSSPSEADEADQLWANRVDLLRAIEWGKPSLFLERRLRAEADQVPYYAPANGTVQVPIPFTLPLQFTDNSAPLSNPSFLPEECIHPENQDAATTPGDVQSLLASWERRCLLSTIVAPDGDSQGLSSRQASEDLKVAEAQITTFLTHILNCRDARHAAQELEGSSAQSFVDAIQNVLDWGTLADASSRAKARQLMRKVAEAGEQLPSSLFITGVNDHDEHPTFGGGFGDVYQASYDGKRVALKRIRTFTADSTTRRNRLQFYKEALVWQGLRHRFILPLLGIDRSTFSPSFCMVSPWMKYGTVLKYLRHHGRGDVNRLLLEIALGLEYLHSMNIVHGDLRGNNILISDDGNACLSDFGLATTFSDADSAAGTTSSSNRAGSIQWFAPELIQPQSFGCERFVRTTATDVYAYACVCLELYTGRPPFAHLPDVAAMLRVIAGDRPEQPTTISDALWQLVTSAWAPEPHVRPSIHEITVALQGGPPTVLASPI